MLLRAFSSRERSHGSLWYIVVVAVVAGLQVHVAYSYLLSDELSLARDFCPCQLAFEAALAHMVREDPSLVVDVDEESGQTVLRGIGELHLEVCACLCPGNRGYRSVVHAKLLMYSTW